MKRKLSTLIVLVVGCLLLLNACVTNDLPLPNSQVPTETPLQGEQINIPGISSPGEGLPCQNGMWQNLKFGQTTEEELLNWLKQNPIVDQKSLEDYYYGPDGGIEDHYYTWIIRAPDERLDIDVISGTVENLIAPILYPLTLEAVVDQLGPPSYIEVYRDVRENDCLYGYAFYYPSQGTVLQGDFHPCSSIYTQDEKTLGPLKGEFLVNLLTCGRAGEELVFFQSIFGITSKQDLEQVKRERLKPWSGFGEVELP